MVAKFYEILINFEKQNIDSEEWVGFGSKIKAIARLRVILAKN